MTQPYPIPRSYRQAGPYDFDGVSTTYGPFGAPSQFSIFDPQDVFVEVRQSPTADWIEATVTIAKTSADPLSSFTVTFGEVFPATHDFRLLGRRLHERSLDVTKGNAISADKLELELSKMAVCLDELRRDVDTPTTEILDAVKSAQTAAAAAVTDRSGAESAAIAAAASAAAAALWDPSSYSTTSQITAMLDGFTPKTRAIASGNGVLINGGASATLSDTVTVSLDYETQANAEAGTSTGRPMNALRVKQAIAAQAPRRGAIGTFGHHGGTTPPPGALVRDGSAISRTIYPELFAEIGTAYGAGDGVNTYNLPDGRGRVDRGDDLGSGRDPGRVHGSAQDDALGSHSHSVTVNTSNSTTGSSVGASAYGASPTYFSTSAVGGVETRMKNISGLPIIWAY